jgi:hypothetical protein
VRVPLASHCWLLLVLTALRQGDTHPWCAGMLRVCAQSRHGANLNMLLKLNMLNVIRVRNRCVEVCAVRHASIYAPKKAKKTNSKADQAERVLDETAATSSKYVPTIGLEIHAQINCASKLFSGAPHVYGQSPNTCVALFDAALPGTLPVRGSMCV